MKKSLNFSRTTHKPKIKKQKSKNKNIQKRTHQNCNDRPHIEQSRWYENPQLLHVPPAEYLSKPYIDTRLADPWQAYYEMQNDNNNSHQRQSVGHRGDVNQDNDDVAHHSGNDSGGGGDGGDGGDGGVSFECNQNYEHEYHNNNDHHHQQQKYQPQHQNQYHEPITKQNDGRPTQEPHQEQHQHDQHLSITSKPVECPLIDHSSLIDSNTDHNFNHNTNTQTISNNTENSHSKQEHEHEHEHKHDQDQVRNTLFHWAGGGNENKNGMVTVMLSVPFSY